LDNFIETVITTKFFENGFKRLLAVKFLDNGFERFLAVIFLRTFYNVSCRQLSSGGFLSGREKLTWTTG
jgi:hypothetical protein